MAEERRRAMDDGLLEISRSIAALREEFADHRVKAGERHTELKTKITAIVGNGQPGLIQKMQTEIDANTKFRHEQASSSATKKDSSAKFMAIVALILSCLGAGAAIVKAIQ